MLEKNIEIVKKELEKLCDENKFNEIKNLAEILKAEELKNN